MLLTFDGADGGSKISLTRRQVSDIVDLCEDVEPKGGKRASYLNGLPR
jgi:hypothetical protein